MTFPNQTFPMVQDDPDPARLSADIRRMRIGDTLITPGATGIILPGSRMLGFLLGVNLNLAGDQPITLGSADYILDRIVMTWKSGVVTLAAGGVYTAAAKGGTALVAATQTYSALSSITSTLSLTLATPANLHRVASTLFFNLTTLNGVAAIADLFVFGVSLDG